MLVAGFPAGPWARNCWVVAPRAGSECLVIDPGKDAAAPLATLLAEHRLHPIAVLLTHGHIDHMWSVTPVSGDFGVPAFVHPDDRYRLTDPWGSDGVPAAWAHELGGLAFVEPDEVRELSDGLTLAVGELTLTVLHTPGHTEGSVVFSVEQTALFSGDLLFAGSIGRTDLPGGDPTAMARSLSRVAVSMPPEMQVYPGHGSATSIGQERLTNPYLVDAVLGGPR